MEKESNQIAGNVIAQIIGRIVVLILALLTIKIITTYLGPDGTGYYNTVITYLSFFITIADFGLFSVGVREISKNPDKLGKILGNIFTIRLISALAAAIVATGVAFLTNYPPEIKYGVAIAAIFLFFNLCGSVFDIFFQYKLEMKRVAVAEAASKFLAVVVVYITALFNLGFYWIVFSVSAAAIGGFIIKYIYASKQTRVALYYDSKLINWIIKLSLPLGVVFIVNNFYFKVDTLILFYFKGAAEVGIYSVAYKILETTIFVAAFLAYSLKPMLSVNIESDRAKAGRAVTHGVTFLIFCALTLAIMSVPFSKQMILFLSGSAFLGGAPVLIILSFAVIFIYVNVLMGEIMIAKDLRRYLLWVSVIVLLFNIVANIILIPRYSYIAAAYTTLACEMLLLVFGFSAARKIIPLSVDFWRITKLIFAATVSVGVAFLLKLNGRYFIFSIILSVGSYIILTYLIGAIPRNMVKGYLLSIKSKWTN